MSSTLLGNVQIQDVPAQEAKPFKALGVVGEAKTREIANGYVQVEVPITYRLNATDTQDKTFTARWNLRPEWLTAEYALKVKQGEVSENEKIQYNINVSGLTRGLFTSAGVTEGAMDFALLEGKLVGFKTKQRKDDPSRLDISYFFKPKS
jgi:hypothetical protein